MKFLGLSLALAMGASAVPLADSHAHSNHMNLHKRNKTDKYGDDTFLIHVKNHCSQDKHFGIFEINSAFDMLESHEPVKIASGKGHTFPANYKGIGMRLSGNADWGCAGQWEPQALFEYGFSGWAGVEGTAYDISMMQGSDPSIGMAVYPADDECESKRCSPEDCPANQGWTSPGQVGVGSPADTVCYQGKTDFTVIFCP